MYYNRFPQYPRTVAQPVKRSAIVPVRFTPAEKSAAEEKAKAAGLTVSEWIRREAGIGHFGRSALMKMPKVEPRPAEPGYVRPEAGYIAPEIGDVKQHPDWNRLVAQESRRMPRRTAERVVRRALERPS